MASANSTSGLRESGEYASARWVVISNVAAADAAADRPEPLALAPHRVGQRRHDLEDAVGSGVGGQVDVVVAADVAPDQLVAHDAAHQVQPVTGRDEGVGQRPHLLEHGLQPLRDHAPTVVVPSSPRPTSQAQ